MKYNSIDSTGIASAGHFPNIIPYLSRVYFLFFFPLKDSFINLLREKTYTMKMKKKNCIANGHNKNTNFILTDLMVNAG